MLKIYNTLTQTKEEFKPLVPGKVGLYVCGITVYDYCHIGHGRLFIVFDMVVRYLRARGFEVHFVRNITDVDDKIINRANESNKTIDEVTEKYIAAMNEDAKALNLLPPSEEPRATVFMPKMLEMIQTLLDKGFAYQGSNGDIYYDVSKYEGYGQLSHKDLDNLRHGERVDVDAAKDDPLDFVLWKSVKPNEPHWEAPWGAGRPGWHIECSAMSTHCLGHNFDIHGGGIDLQFPHHENERAQSEAATGKKFVNTWMHNGFVQVDEEKMSKSLNNFFTIRDVLKDYNGEVVRYFMIASHYRSPVNYALEQLDNAKAALERFYLCLRDLDLSNVDFDETHADVQRFYEAMDDDFNTPEALAVLFDVTKEVNRLKAQGDFTQASQLGKRLQTLGQTLGILHLSPNEFLKGDVDESKIMSLIEEREQARANKDFATSDRIRDELLSQGILLEDSASGTKWRRAD